MEELLHVLSTGGGAYIDADARALKRSKAVTVWLRAELDVLFDRVRKRGHRPLLRNGDPKEVLARLMTQRYPIYAEADIVADSTPPPQLRHRDRAGPARSGRRPLPATAGGPQGHYRQRRDRGADLRRPTRGL